jgi:hypothetical protein
MDALFATVTAAVAATPAAPDPQKLEAFVGRMLGDLGAASAVPLVRIGDELGLYAAMDGAGPLTPAELARRTVANERLCANGSPRTSPPATWSTTRRRAASP